MFNEDYETQIQRIFSAKWAYFSWSQFGSIKFQTVKLFARNSIGLNFKWTDKNEIFKLQVNCAILWRYFTAKHAFFLCLSKNSTLKISSWKVMDLWFYLEKKSNPSSHNHISCNFIEYFPFALHSHSTLSSVPLLLDAQRYELYKLRFWTQSYYGK